MSKIKLPKAICELLDEEGTVSGVLRRILSKENSDPEAAMRWLENLIEKDPLRFIYDVYFATNNGYEPEQEKLYHLVVAQNKNTDNYCVNIDEETGDCFIAGRYEINNYKTRFTKAKCEALADKFGLVIAPGKFELVEVQDE